LTWCNPQLGVKQNFGLNIDLSCAPLLYVLNKSLFNSNFWSWALDQSVKLGLFWILSG